MFNRQLIQKDTFIQSAYPYKNQGKNNQLYCHNKVKDSSGLYTLTNMEETRTVFRFDGDAIVSYLTEHDKALTDEDVKIEIQFVISNWLTESEDFDIVAYPLTKSFYENYGNDVNSINSGCNWLSADTETDWTNDGGDYNDEYTNIDLTLDEKTMTMTIDVKQYLQDHLNNNNGIILIANGNVRNFAMYSSQSQYAVPYVNIYFNDYEIDTSTDISIFNINNSVPIIKTRLNKNEFINGETLMIQLLIMDKYSRGSFELGNTFSYLPNIKYRIIDRTRKRLLNDFRDETRVPVRKNGNFLHLPLDNLLEGFYRIEFLYENTINNIKTSQHCDFRINN